MLESSDYWQVVEKLNKSGMSLNKRIIVIHEEDIMYYSKIPEDVTEANFEPVSQKTVPKERVSVHLIQAQPLPTSVLKKWKRSGGLKITFPANAARMKTNTKAETTVSAGNKTKEWVIFFNDPSESVDAYKEAKESSVRRNSPLERKTITPTEKLSAFSELRQAESQRVQGQDRLYLIKNESSSPAGRQSVSKFEEGNDNDDMDDDKELIMEDEEDEDEEKEKIKSASIPTRVSLADLYKDKKEPVENEEVEEPKTKEETEFDKEKRKQEELQKEMQRLGVDDEVRKRREIDDKKKLDRMKKLENAWEFKFNLMWDDNIRSLTTFDENMRTGFALFKYMGEFRTKAIDICREIVDEFYLPKNERKYQPLAFQQDEGYEDDEDDEDNEEEKEDSQKIYHVNNMIIRLTWCEHNANDSDKENPDIVRTQKFIKSYGHEFRGMDIIGDALYVINKKVKDLLYRVPLTTLIDYKGFRCLISCSPPVQGEETVVQGPSTSGIFKLHKPILEDLKTIAKALNLKEHRFVWDDKVTSVMADLSIFVEIHKVQFNGFEDVIQDRLKNHKKGNYNENKLSFGERRSPELYYFMRTADIFPIDIDLDSKTPIAFLHRLRPEFLITYERPLSADAFMSNVESVESERDDIEVAEAGKNLRIKSIASLIKTLDNLSIIPIDSMSLTQAFHAHGVNMRLLYKVWSASDLPHIKEICQIEMIARSAKKLLRKKLADLIHYRHEDKKKNHGETLFGLPENDSDTPGTRSSGFKKGSEDYKDTSPITKGKDTREKMIQNKNLAEKMENEIAICVINFLNLIFGMGTEPDNYWNNTLKKQIQYDFDFDPDVMNIRDVTMGGLLHAIIHHCGIDLKIDVDVLPKELGVVPIPFKKAHLLGMRPESRVFQLRNVDIKLLSEKYREYRNNKSYELCVKACNIKFSLDKAISYRGESPGDPIIYADLGETLLEMNEVEKASEKGSMGHKLCHRLHAEKVKCLCVLMRVQMQKNQVDKALEYFDEALRILDFHLGRFHPLHSTVYSILGHFYAEKKMFQDALFLYKSSLVCCVRILGPNHAHTGEVYTDLANLMLRMGQKDEALNNFEKAYLVFEAAKGSECDDCAATSFQMANIQLGFGKIQDAMGSVYKAMRIYEKDEDKYVHKLLECCWLVCVVSETSGDTKLGIQYSERIWNFIEKYNMEEDQLYRLRILSLTLTILINSLSSDKKNFLYRIFDAVADCLHKEGDIDKLYGGGGETSFQRQYLRDTMEQAHQNKTIANFIKDLLKFLLQNTHELDLKSMFGDYRKFLHESTDEQLRESLISFEKLIYIQGLSFFYEILKRN